MAGYIGTQAVSVNTTSATISDDLAVGDDALITGTLTTTAKAVSNGGIGMPDDAKLTFGGTGTGDLQIYHDGTNSYISDQGTNDLKILATDFQLKNAADNEFMITGVADGAVTLYHNNAAKIATASDGVSVTGDVAITSGGTLDIFNSGNAATTLTALLGADNGSGNGRTNSAVKSTVVGVPHYTNSEEAVGLIVAGSTSSSNFMNIGGGTSVVNAMNTISFNTAANQTTTTGTARMTVENNGDVTVEDGNLVIGTSGHGIDFSATSDGAGTDTSETLHDYEEGTFTPLLSNAKPSGGNVTFSSQIGVYTKIGNVVMFSLSVLANGSTIEASNNEVLVVGLPYDVKNISSQHFPPASLFCDSGFNQSAATQGYIPVLINGTAGIKIFGILSAATSNQNVLRYNELGRGNTTTSFAFRIAGTYRTA